MVESPDEPLARLEDLQRPWGLRRTRDAPPFQRCAFEVCVARRAHLSFDQHAVGRRADDPAVRTATEPDRRHVLAADRARISSHPRLMPRPPALSTRLDVHTTVPASRIGVVARRAQAVAGGACSGGARPNRSAERRGRTGVASTGVVVMGATPCVIYAAKSTEDLRGSIPDQLRECRGPQLDVQVGFAAGARVVSMMSPFPTGGSAAVRRQGKRMSRPTASSRQGLPQRPKKWTWWESNPLRWG
jgi:hypothetical protein